MEIRGKSQRKPKNKINETNRATRTILEFLLSAGAFAWRQNVLPLPSKSGMLRSASKKGLPDIMGIRQYYCGRCGITSVGQFFGVEIKKGRDKIRDEQEGFHFTARKLGAIIIVAVGDDSQEIFDSFYRQWLVLTSVEHE